MMVIDSIQAAAVTGSGTGTPSGVLNSDVSTKGSIFNDLGTAMMRIVPKNITTVTGPTTNNEVTITRVHVNYRRPDGLSQPGADVPYPFDGAATVTLPATGLAVPVVFELVRHDAKLEPPLLDLRYKLVVLNTIAELTFYGADRAGNEINTTGYIYVDFADFGDPQ
jgi:hypothetical protein